MREPRNRIIPMFVPHAGCPERCVFCNQRAIAADAPPDDRALRGQIEAGIARAGRGAELAFYGGSFTAIPAMERARYLLAARPYLDAGALCGIRVSTRPDCVDDAVLEELMGAGVRTIELGAQSMEPEVLAAAGRGHTPAHVEAASRLIKRHGCSLVLQMMTGLPEERDAMQTARALAALRPDGVRVYPTVVLRGTALAELWRAGRYTPPGVAEAAEMAGRLLEYFWSERIPVLRIGLQPTEALAREVLAGGYHPSLGALARESLCFRHMDRALREADTRPGERYCFRVSARTGSLFRGHNRSNLVALRERYRLEKLWVEEREMLPDTAKICAVGRFLLKKME